MKKQSWINEHWLLTKILVIGGILIFIWGTYAYSKTSSYICSKHPEKCVCDSPFECSHFRLKTPTELQIDNCNSNPREDNKCKCEGYVDDLDKPTGGYACPNSCENITIKDCHIRGLFSYDKEIEIEGYILYDNYCETKLQYNQPITSFRNVSSYFTEVNITHCEQCWNYEQKCIKSRPKTDYEKHPEDYVAECNENDLLQNTTFGLKCLHCGKSKCDFSKAGGGALLEPTYRLKNECEKENSNFEVIIQQTNVQGCLVYANETESCEKPEFKTICREKTEEEK